MNETRAKYRYINTNALLDLYEVILYEVILYELSLLEYFVKFHQTLEMYR